MSSMLSSVASSSGMKAPSSTAGTPRPHGRDKADTLHTSIATLATIARLNARLAEVENHLTLASSNLTNLESKNETLSSRLVNEQTETIALREQLAGYQEIANQCEEILTTHDQLQTRSAELEDLLVAKESELAGTKEKEKEYKIRNKKLRLEILQRRSETNWREVSENAEEIRLYEIKLLEQRKLVCDREREAALQKIDNAHLETILQERETEAQQQQGRAERYKGLLGEEQLKSKLRQEQIAGYRAKWEEEETRASELQASNERLEEQLANLKKELAQAKKRTTEQSVESVSSRPRRLLCGHHD